MLDKRDSHGDKLITYALRGKKWETVYFLLQQSDKVEQEINSLGIGDALEYVFDNKKIPTKEERTKTFKVYDEVLKKIIIYYVEHGAEIKTLAFLSATPEDVDSISDVTDDEMEMMNYLIDHGATLSNRDGNILKKYTPALYEYYKSRGVITESC